MKSNQAWAAWDEEWQEEASVSPQEELQIMAQKAKLIYADLPATGKKVWKALNQCISSTLSAGAVHFERDLRHELETQLGQCELTRQAGSQWVLKAEGRTFYASVRSEVLGDQNARVLTKLRDQARTVKRGLLQDGAEWLRDLVNGDQEPSDFLDAIRMGIFDMEGMPKGSGKGKYGGKGDDKCHICDKSLYQDLLSGKHMCKVVVTFECCGTWVSHSGRYNVQEGRIMGQRCKKCGEYGDPWENFQLADDASIGEGPQKAHRGDLCEACERYGNCKGVFSNPFEIAMAMELLYDQPAQWTRHKEGNLWLTEVEDVVVVLQPHVFASRDRKSVV